MPGARRRAAHEAPFVYESALLAPGEHTVKVTVAGTRNPASTGTTITIDRAVATG